MEMHNQLVKLAELAPGLQDSIGKTEIKEKAARALLLDPQENTATALYLATRTLHGIDILIWEPESLWLTLKKYGIDLPEAERNKLQAAMALQLTPSFYWDSISFQQVAQALNGELFDPEVLQEPHPAHMEWAAYEAGILRGLDPSDQGIPEFDEDVQMFVAVVLNRAGHLTTPEGLNFADTALTALQLPATRRAKKEIAGAWTSLDKSELAHAEFGEDQRGVQMSKLASCYLYNKQMSDQLSSEFVTLGLIG